MSDRAKIIETAKRVLERSHRTGAEINLAKAVIDMAEHDQSQRELCNKAIEAMVQRRWRDLPPLMLALQRSLYYESLSQPPTPGGENA